MAQIAIVHKSTGEFIKWVFSDTLKESGDSLRASNLIEADVRSKISEKAYFFFKNAIVKNANPKK